MIERTLRCLIAALCLAGSPVWPADDSEPDGPARAPELSHTVVVTATRVETPDREVASSIIVLTRADLERSRKVFVIDALRELAGLSVQENGPAGAAATVMLRGANSEHTRVMLDGVEVNDPSSPSRSYDFGHLLLAGIDRIEVILGPQSPLYGSDALGGVINIITRRGEGRTRTSASLLGGTYGTGAGRLAIGGGPGRISFALDASFFSSNGFSSAGTAYAGNDERDGTRNLSLSGRLGYAPGDNLDFDLILRRTLVRTDLDNFGGPFGDDPNNGQDYDQAFIKGQARLRLLRSRWEQRLAFSHVSQDRAYDNPRDAGHPLDSERGDYHGGLTGLDWQHTVYAHASHIIVFGVEFQRESGRSEYVYESAWGRSDSAFPERSAGTAGIYVQDQIKLGSGFFAAVGGRVDRHSRFGGAFTWRLAPACVIPGTATKLKMTLGTGFKSPSLYQLFAPATMWGPIGNAGLSPETSVGWDAGLEQPLFGGRLTIGAAYFRNEFRNLIQFDYARGYTNTGRAVTEGLDAFAAARFGPDTTLQAAYNHTLSRDEATGLDLLRRPRDRVTVRLAAPLPEGLRLDVSLAAVGERDDLRFTDFASIRTRLPGYVLLNAVLTREVAAWGQVFLRLDNILDQRYETVYGYGMPRFSVYAGLSIGS